MESSIAQQPGNEVGCHNTYDTKPPKKKFTLEKGMELGIKGSVYRCIAVNSKKGTAKMKFVRTDPSAM